LGLASDDADLLHLAAYGVTVMRVPNMERVPTTGLPSQ
jgi:hypothetical protein